MKRLLVITLILSTFLGLKAQEQVILLNYNALEKKFDKNEAAVKDDKKGVNPKTWYSRGKILQQIFNIDLEYIAEGSGETEIILYYKEPLEKVVDPEDPSIKTIKYERINYIMKDGALSVWERQKSITENPLNKAYEAYLKVLELDSKAKYTVKVKDELTLLKSDYMRQGINAYYGEHFETALEDFESVLKINKLDLFEGETDTMMIQYSGIIARELKDYKKSAMYYQKLADINYGGPNTYLNIKNDYLILEDSVAAIEVMEEAFDKYPDTLNVVANLVDMYIKTGKIDQGIKKVENCINKNPDSGQLYYWKGRLLLNADNEDRIDLALEVYKKAIELDQSLYYVYYDIGFIYFLQGQDIFSQGGMEKDVERRAEINKVATEKYNASIPMMEKALALNNENSEIKKETLDVLKRIYYKLYGSEDNKYLDIMEKLNNF